MQSVQIVHVATGELRSGFYQCPSGCPLYEAEGLTQDTLPFEVDIYNVQPTRTQSHGRSS